MGFQMEIDLPSRDGRCRELDFSASSRVTGQLLCTSLSLSSSLNPSVTLNPSMAVLFISLMHNTSLSLDQPIYIYKPRKLINSCLSIYIYIYIELISEVSLRREKAAENQIFSHLFCIPFISLSQK